MIFNCKALKLEMPKEEVSYSLTQQRSSQQKSCQTVIDVGFKFKNLRGEVKVRGDRAARVW